MCWRWACFMAVSSNGYTFREGNYDKRVFASLLKGVYSEMKNLLPKSNPFFAPPPLPPPTYTPPLAKQGILVAVDYFGSNTLCVWVVTH